MDFYVVLYLQNAVVSVIDKHIASLIVALFYMLLMICCKVKGIMHIAIMNP